jgi:AmiR/NasT family two-component response regulator
MGINQFLLRSDMHARLQDLEERRRGRRAVLRATIFLMREQGIDEDTAYSQLRRESMRTRQSLETYCEEYLGRRANPPDTPERTSSTTLRGGNKQAM